MNPEALRHPSILRVERVAKALGDMVAEVVFIGGIKGFDKVRRTPSIFIVGAPEMMTRSTWSQLASIQVEAARHGTDWRSKPASRPLWRAAL